MARVVSYFGGHAKTVEASRATYFLATYLLMSDLGHHHPFYFAYAGSQGEVYLLKGHAERHELAYVPGAR